MAVARPGDHEPVAPRPAASILLLRGGAATLEVLLVQRTLAARFMAGYWVFPGGAVDAHAGDDTHPRDAEHRSAAVRELEEEASVGGVGRAALVPFSRWITPPALPIRFDTRFFLAAAPEGAVPAVDGDECIDLAWLTPAAALQAHGRGSIELACPTLTLLRQVGGFDSTRAALEHARGQVVRPVRDRIVAEGEAARILLPGEAA